jgi:hypothetical protein
MNQPGPKVTSAPMIPFGGAPVLPSDERGGGRSDTTAMALASAPGRPVVS